MIEAEVQRRFAAFTSQLGFDLSERYPTRSDVEQAIAGSLKAEADRMKKSMDDFAEKVESTDPGDPDHPLSFLVDIITSIRGLHLRVTQIGMYILAKEARKARGPETLAKTMKLARIEEVTVDQEREAFLRDVARSKTATNDPSILAVVAELEELLGRPPEEPKPDAKSKPN